MLVRYYWINIENLSKEMDNLQQKLHSMFEIKIDENKLSRTISSICYQIKTLSEKMGLFETNFYERQRRNQIKIVNIQKESKDYMKLLDEKLEAKSQENKSQKQSTQKKIQQHLINFENKFNVKIDIFNQQFQKLNFKVQHQNEQKSEQTKSWNEIIEKKFDEQMTKNIQISQNLHNLKLFYAEGGEKLNELKNEVDYLKQSFSINKSEICDSKGQQKPQKTTFNQKNQKSKFTRNTFCHQDEKNKLISKINQLKSLQYLAINQKVDKLQKRISRQQAPLNIDKYPRRHTYMCKSQSPFHSDDQILISSDKENPQKQSIDDLPKKQFQNFKKEITEKVQEFKKQLQNFNIQIDTLTEKERTNFRKLNKIVHLEKEFTEQFQSMKKLKMQKSTIQQINFRYKQIENRLLQEQQKELHLEKIKEQIKKSNEKISKITEEIALKANTKTTKIAIQYIQSKVRDIIVVISDNFSKQKSSAIKKYQDIRCLTCDNQTEAPDDKRYILTSQKKLRRGTSIKNLRKTATRIPQNIRPSLFYDQ